MWWCFFFEFWIIVLFLFFSGWFWEFCLLVRIYVGFVMYFGGVGFVEGRIGVGFVVDISVIDVF